MFFFLFPLCLYTYRAYMCGYKSVILNTMKSVLEQVVIRVDYK